MASCAKPRAWKCRTGLSRGLRRRAGEWVSMAQLAREVDVAYNRWLQKRSDGAVIVVKRRQGRPRNPAVTAAAKEWRSLGCPAHLLKQICAKHGVKPPAVKKRVGQPERRAAA